MALPRSLALAAVLVGAAAVRRAAVVAGPSEALHAAGSLAQLAEGARSPGVPSNFALSAMMPLSASPNPGGSYGASPATQSFFGSRMAAAVSAPMATAELPATNDTAPAIIGGAYKPVINLQTDFPDDDLPQVLGTIGKSAVDELVMAPEIAHKVIAQEIGRIRLEEKSSGLRSDRYIADLAADPDEKVMIEIMDTEDERTVREISARKVLAQAYGEKPMPGVFPVLRVDVFKESTFIVMHHADGTFADIVDTRKVSIGELVLMALDLLHGVRCLEEANIVHGRMDKKSFVLKDGRWYLSGFTQALVMSEGAAAEPTPFGTDAWLLLGNLRKAIVSGNVDRNDDHFRRKFLALLELHETDRDMTAREAITKLQVFAHALGVETPNAKALEPPVAWIVEPSEQQRFPTKAGLPQPREDGEPLYPELHARYVQPWGTSGQAHDGEAEVPDFDKYTFGDVKETAPFLTDEDLRDFE